MPLLSALCFSLVMCQLVDPQFRQADEAQVQSRGSNERAAHSKTKKSKAGNIMRAEEQCELYVRPKSPESEIAAKNFADMGEKRGENLAKFFAKFRPSISRRSGRKKFHEKSMTNSTSHETKFFHRETLGAWGHNIWVDMAQGTSTQYVAFFVSGGRD